MSTSTVLVATIKIRPGEDQAFTEWQARHEAAVSKFPGFISSDMIPLGPPANREWTIVLNFRTKEDLAVWQKSEERAAIVSETFRFAERGDFGQVLPIENAKEPEAAITEVIVSKVKEGQGEAYRAWASRIQMAQAKYPGYRGMYLQPPSSGAGGHWTTLLRFDTLEHLLAWKNAPERAALLKEAEAFIESEELMRLASSFPGWVPINPATGEGPPNWKTALLVLLGLYPAVVLELRFVGPHLSSLNPSVAIFIGNIITVSFTSFLSMPLFVRWFGWWLFVDKKVRPWREALGLGILLLLYAIEIALLWRMFL